MTFKDWKKIYDKEGLFPDWLNNPDLTGSRLSYKTVSLGILRIIQTTNKIEENEMEKIDQFKKDLFNEQVAYELWLLKTDFESRYSQFKDPGKLLNIEISNYSKVIDIENFPDISNLQTFYSDRADSIRRKYFKLFIEGNDTIYLNQLNEDEYMDYISAASIKEYLQWLETYKPTKQDIKEFPPLPDCFIDKEFFYVMLEYPKVSELYTKQENSSYHLKQGKKAYLGGLAVRLLNTGKLKDVIKTNQDCARVFCRFFNVNFNAKEEKQFQPERAKTEDFDFIK
jgi:hypothetical protein